MRPTHVPEIAPTPPLSRRAVDGVALRGGIAPDSDHAGTVTRCRPPPPPTQTSASRHARLFLELREFADATTLTTRSVAHRRDERPNRAHQLAHHTRTTHPHTPHTRHTRTSHRSPLIVTPALPQTQPASASTRPRRGTPCPAASRPSHVLRRAHHHVPAPALDDHGLARWARPPQPLRSTTTLSRGRLTGHCSPRARRPRSRAMGTATAATALDNHAVAREAQRPLQPSCSTTSSRSRDLHPVVCGGNHRPIRS